MTTERPILFSATMVPEAHAMTDDEIAESVKNAFLPIIRRLPTKERQSRTREPLKDCPVCGKRVRLGAMKIRFNRKPGITHYIAHMDGSPMHDDGWKCVAMKPYAAREEDRPWAQLCTKWNDLRRMADEKEQA